MKKLSELQIRQVIKEELKKVLNEQQDINYAQIIDRIKTSLMHVTGSMKQNLRSDTPEAQKSIAEIKTLPFVSTVNSLVIDPANSKNVNVVFQHKNGSTYRVKFTGNFVVVVDDKTNGILYRT